MTLEDFNTFIGSKQGFVNQVGGLLKKPLGDSPEALDNDARQILAYRCHMVDIRDTVNLYYRNLREEFMPPKTKELTEEHRKIKLDKEIAPIRYWLEKLDGYIETLDEIVSFAQSSLAYHRQNLHSLGREQ
jgi:hypothetical protein